MFLGNSLKKLNDEHANILSVLGVFYCIDFVIICNVTGLLLFVLNLSKKKLIQKNEPK
jgi:hypothetical protein